MPIRKLLQRPVHSLPPDASCEDAALLMRDQNIGCVVVADAARRPVGVVTDRDLVIWAIAEGHDARKLRLRDIMSDEPIFLSSDQGLDQVVTAMRELAIRRVPIVDEAGELCGLVSMDDLVILLADQIGSLAEAVREEVRAPAR